LDKTSTLAFILYSVTSSKEVKEAAVKLLIGDLTIKQLNAMKETNKHIKAASKELRKGKINSNELIKFIENHIY
jgi:hypothetical protein